MGAPSRCAARSRLAAFTLLELLVVIGLISVLMGLGIGFLRRGDTTRSAALSAVSGELRRASNTARSRSLPTDVVFDPGVGADGAAVPSRVWARVLAPVGAWHFEPGERQLMAALEPETNAVAGPGRFGQAARIDNGGKGAMMSLRADGARFDVRDGFALRMDLWREGGEVMVLARLGQGLDVRIENGGFPAVRMVQAGTNNGAGAALTLRSQQPIDFERWQQLEVVHDRTNLSLRIDGSEVATAAAPGALFQRDGDILDISPADAPFDGWIDEVELLAYQRSEPQLLPLEVEITRAVTIHLDAQGDPQQPATFEWRLHGDDVVESFRVKAGGVLQ